MEFTIIAAIVFMHFVADFLAQTREMGRNKSKSNLWLLAHAVTYSTVIFILAIPLLPITVGMCAIYAGINGMLHYMVDYMSSRMTTYLYNNKQEYWFWSTIGADQSIHTLVTLGSYILITMIG